MENACHATGTMTKATKADRATRHTPGAVVGWSEEPSTLGRWSCGSLAATAATDGADGGWNTTVSFGGVVPTADAPDPTGADRRTTAVDAARRTNRHRV